MVSALKSRSKSLSTAANLANLLPTGTVLAFQALVPSFSNNGVCEIANKYLTLSAIVFFSLVCFLSSFTDSFLGSNGKLYYGIATPRGMFVFNDDDEDSDSFESKEGKRQDEEEKLKDFKINLKDFVHALMSLIVFLVFAISSTNVQTCFLAKVGNNGNQLIMNLPLGAGALASFLFMLFPTKRRGIGFADMAPSASHHPKRKATDEAEMATRV